MCVRIDSDFMFLIAFLKHIFMMHLQKFRAQTALNCQDTSKIFWQLFNNQCIQS